MCLWTLMRLIGTAFSYGAAGSKLEGWPQSLPIFIFIRITRSLMARATSISLPDM